MNSNVTPEERRRSALRQFKESAHYEEVLALLDEFSLSALGPYDAAMSEVRNFPEKYPQQVCPRDLALIFEGRQSVGKVIEQEVNASCQTT